MADMRNNKTKIVKNDSSHYKKLYDRRGLKRISHYATPRFRHPTVAQRASVSATGHIWAYGDRFYKLANEYYGDVRYWWVIAWWNGYPTEASVKTGDFLDIPLNINEALDVLGV